MLPHLAELASEDVLHAVGLSVLSIDSADEHVVGDVVEVPSELEPGPCHRDVVSRTLALHEDAETATAQVMRSSNAFVCGYVSAAP